MEITGTHHESLTLTRSHTHTGRLSLPFKSGPSPCLLVWNHFVRLSASPENRRRAIEWSEREQEGIKAGYNVRHFLDISSCMVHKDLHHITAAY